MKLEQALDVARRDLLDLGLRNPLLNYRPLKARGVEVISAVSSELFKTLVTEEKKLTFEPVAAPVTTPPAKPAANSLPTSYTPTQLQDRLLATHHAARTSIEEQGVNTLYLALGMLRWFEDAESTKEHRAPLILIPVELQRNDARDRFQLSFTGEDLVANESLTEKLKVDFECKGFPDLPDHDDLDVEAYLQAVAQLVKSQPRWSVEPNAIALGFFSFAKLLMYRDLDPATWKTAERNGGLLDHELLQRLMGDAGFAPPPSKYNEDTLLDEQLNGHPPVQVVDADSSQTLAILDAIDGRNLVIQGPPGTGKSQTIVNLISAAVAEGKKVLFVAEKMAALDVVKRRLEAIGLGPLCLVMHGTGGDKARSIKRKVIDDLKATVFKAPAAAPRNRKEAELLAGSRNQLNAYCHAVNDPIGETGEAPCSAYGKMLAANGQLNNLELPLLRLDAGHWTLAESRQRHALIAQLQDRLTRCGVPTAHPFWGSQLTVLLPSDRDAVAAALRTALQRLATVSQAATKLSDACGADSQHVSLLAATAECVAKAPAMLEVDPNSSAWLQKEADILAAIAAGQEHRALHRKYARQLTAEAWSTDVTNLSVTVSELGSSWLRFLIPKWRRAKAEFARLCVDASSRPPAAMLDLLTAIRKASQCEKLMAASDAIMRALFGANWQGPASDWDLLQSQAAWTIAAQKRINAGELAASCLAAQTLSFDTSRLNQLLKDLRAASTQLESAQANLQTTLKSEPPPANQSTQSLEQIWTRQLANIDRFSPSPAITRSPPNFRNPASSQSSPSRKPGPRRQKNSSRYSSAPASPPSSNAPSANGPPSPTSTARTTTAPSTNSASSTAWTWRPTAPPSPRKLPPPCPPVLAAEPSASSTVSSKRSENYCPSASLWNRPATPCRASSRCS